MIRAIAIDDEPPALRVLEHFCQQSSMITLQKTFTRPEEARAYLKKFPVDVLFLDIQMPGTSGIAFYKHIPENIAVIFTTAYSEYAVEGFNLQATDYLLKPFTFERFEQALKKAETELERKKNATYNENACVMVRADYSLIKIPVNDIVLIEGLDDYLKIFVADNPKPVVTRMTMKSILEKLPDEAFCRVHRSFIVPLKKIESMRNKQIKVGPFEVPVGNRFEEDFLKKFNT